MLVALLLSALVFAPTTFAAEPLDVQLDNPAYAGVVKNFLESRQHQFRFVDEVDVTHSFVKFGMIADFSRGTRCKLLVDANINGAETNMVWSEAGFEADDAAAFCADFVRTRILSSLRFIL